LKKIFNIALLIVLLTSCKTKKEVVDPFGNANTSRSKVDTTSLRRSTGYFIDAMTEKIRGNYQEAINLFEASLKYNPKNAAAMYNLSGLYDISGRTLPALELSKKAVQIDSDNQWYLVQLAYLYNRNLLYKESIQTFEKLIKKFPKDIDNYYPYTEVLLKNNQYDKAIETLNELEKIMGYDEQLVFNKYRLYAQMKKYEEAIIEIEKLIEHDPSDISNYGIIAEIYLEMKNTPKAMEYYEKMLAIDPNNGMVHLSLSDYYNSQGNDARSLEELKLAFGSPTLEIDTKMKILLDYYYRPGDDAFKKETYELLDLMEKAHPDNAKPYAIYGDFLMAENKVSEARDKFRKAISLDKDKFIIWNQLLTIEAQLKDDQALYDESKEALELFPTQAQFYYFNGYAAFQLQKYKEATESLEAGRALLVDDKELEVEFLQLLGDAYHKLKEHELSDEIYEKALKINPENVYVLNNYAYYLSERRIKMDYAEKLAEKCNMIAPAQSNFEDTYAWIFFLQKKYADAEKWMKKALDHGGNSSGVLLEHYGDILFHLDKTDEAVEYWKKAKEKGGNSPVIDKKINDKKYYE
jgi:tetratricopeptide (TPR) repeat protein